MTTAGDFQGFIELNPCFKANKTTSALDADRKRHTTGFWMSPKPGVSRKTPPAGERTALENSHPTNHAVIVLLCFLCEELVSV